MNDNIIRDFAIIAALGNLFVEQGISPNEIMTEDEIAKVDKLCDALPDDSTRYTEIAKRMFREAIDRLLVAEVTPPAAE